MDWRTEMRRSSAAKTPPPAELVGQGRLADQEPDERAARVHVGVGQEPRLFELGRAEKAGLVEDEDHFAVTLGLFSGQQGHHLVDRLGLVEPRRRLRAAVMAT